MKHDLSLTALSRAYRSATLTPRQLIQSLLEDMHAQQDPAWITRLTMAQIEPWLARLESSSPEALPLYGIPFAIKDNIDLAEVPTTAACPAFAYTPAESAFVVQRLIDAGAIPLGKTNLDQFATGLVGERAPALYGTPACAFDPEYIAGGSSSGSAVVTARGEVSFALGTDTAGSGRIPACFNGLVGVKPTLGLLSTHGVVPACATLDTISLMALTSDDAATLLGVVSHYDAKSPWSRQHDFAAHGQRYGQLDVPLRFGVPLPSQWGTDDAYSAAIEKAIGALESLGAERVDIDATPMLEAAKLLYDGPWIAERYHATRGLIETNPEALHPVTREILGNGNAASAVDYFDAHYRLAEYKRQADALMAEFDFLVMPTTTHHPRKAEVAEAPISVNSHLGRWTNFVNLLNFSALAVPTGMTPQSLPDGVTLVGQAFDDLLLLCVSRSLEPVLSAPMGATGYARPAPANASPARLGDMNVVVCGAHLSGLALNHQLTSRGGQLARQAKTSPHYRLYRLAGGPPARPALVRDERVGCQIDVEVWRLPIRSVGSFLGDIPAPLGLGKITLDDDSVETGFICAANALDQGGEAEEISAFGGWRAWLATQ